MTTTEILLWDVLPYVTIAVFVVGMVWRYRYDKFGWTTRSSQLYERSLLRIASPLFHLGMLAVVGGHVIGLLIPEDWTDALGVSEDLYHLNAIVLGSLAGLATLVGVQAFRLPLELLMHRAGGLGIMPPELSYGGYNYDIVTGGWRKLNFQKAPFNMPAPLDSIHEDCQEGRYFADKVMALWDTSELRIDTDRS